MTERTEKKRRLTGVDARIKIVYLLAVAIGVLAISDFRFAVSVLAFQALLWALAGIQRQDFRIFRKGLPFALAIIFFGSFFGPDRDFVLFSFLDYSVRVTVAGFTASLFMVARFFTILLASLVVRVTTSSEEFVEALVGLKMPRNGALVLDNVLASLEGKGGGGGGGGKGKGKGQGKEKGKSQKAYSLRGILRGDFSFLIDTLHRRMAEAKERFADHDWAVISAITVFIVGVRMIKILPGIPIAPGHKNVLIIPLFILAASLTKKRFAATTVGLLSGIVSFMFGFGKYGVLGILQFAVPGLVVDILVGLTFGSQNFWMLGLIGLCAGLARIVAEVLMAVVFGLPTAFYVFFAPLFLSQCTFGALSAPVSKYLLKNFNEKNKDFINTETKEEKVYGKQKQFG